MTDIILPPTLQRAKENKMARGKELANINQVFNIVGNLAGPMAVVVEEMKEKIGRLEDRAGITDETVAQETASPGGTKWWIQLQMLEIRERLGAIEQALIVLGVMTVADVEARIAAHAHATAPSTADGRQYNAPVPESTGPSVSPSSLPSGDVE